MTDITLSLTNNQFDWLITNNDLVWSNDNGIQTAVLISLFTDRVAPIDYKFDPFEYDPRGVWSDTYNDYIVGSLLWTLTKRAVITSKQTLLAQAQQMCLNALQWMVKENLIYNLSVNCSFLNSTTLAIQVQLTSYNSNKPQIIDTVFPF